MRRSYVAGIVGLAVVIVIVIILAVTLQPSGEDVSLESSSLGNYFTSCSSHEKHSPVGRYSTAAASSDAAPCASIAIEILRKNGNAIDAAIAAQFCIGVLNAQSSGLGGGFFATYYSKKEERVYALDAREVAPSAAYPQMYDPEFNKELQNKTGKWWEEKKSANLKGGLSVAVPGEVAGLWALYKKFGGKLSWEALIEPTIKICEEGYKLTWYTGGFMQLMKDDILREPSMRLFTNATETRVLVEGETVRRPQLAKTLRKIQMEPQSMYTGDLADAFVKDLKGFGGIITKEDLVNYRPVWREPVKVNLENGNFTLYSFPPPGAGLLLGLILQILDKFGFTKESLSARQLEQTHHRVIEAFKFSYAQRYRMGDLDIQEAKSLLDELSSDEFAAAINPNILDDKTNSDPSFYGTETVPVPDQGTAHFSLVAPDGDAISITSSINYAFGAGIRSESTGIIYNNEMADFTARSELDKQGNMNMKNNLIKPGKRPLSSMCPSIVLDSEGQVRLVFGAAGGILIPSANAWVAARNLWMGESLNEAIDACRTHHSLVPMKLQFEKGFDPNILVSLRSKGHKTEEYKWKSVVIAVARDQEGQLVSSTDYRKSGGIDGF